jgi:hypothetical protein
MRNFLTSTREQLSKWISFGATLRAGREQQLRANPRDVVFGESMTEFAPTCRHTGFDGRAPQVLLAASELDSNVVASEHQFIRIGVRCRKRKSLPVPLHL